MQKSALNSCCVEGSYILRKSVNRVGDSSQPHRKSQQGMVLGKRPQAHKSLTRTYHLRPYPQRDASYHRVFMVAWQAVCTLCMCCVRGFESRLRGPRLGIPCVCAPVHWLMPLAGPARRIVLVAAKCGSAGSAGLGSKPHLRRRSFGSLVCSLSESIGVSLLVVLYGRVSNY